MRIAIISDIHSNLEALTKALEIIEDEGTDEIVCLGDIVGYGADPNECIELVRHRCSTIILGNHDLAAVDLSAAEFFTSNARSAAVWTSQHLTGEHKQFLRNLPYTAERDEMLFVHSSAFQPEEWHYIMSALDAQATFGHFTQQLCFVGHSHIPGIYSESGPRHSVVRGERFVINVGSVGQPRDGNPKLSFGIFDTDRWEYRNIREEYDVGQACSKIRTAGLPRALADRLLEGV